MPLSYAEKMATIPGARTNFVHTLTTLMEKWPRQVILTTQRNRIYQTIGHVAHALSTLPKFPKLTTTALSNWLSEIQKIHNEEDIMDDIDTFIQIVFCHLEIAFPLGKLTRRLAPIEFVYGAILVHLYKDTLDGRQISRAIYTMRCFVRQEHHDIRMNDQVSKTLNNFVFEEMPRRVTVTAPDTSLPLRSRYKKRQRTSSAESGSDHGHRHLLESRHSSSPQSGNITSQSCSVYLLLPPSEHSLVAERVGMQDSDSIQSMDEYSTCESD